VSTWNLDEGQNVPCYDQSAGCPASKKGAGSWRQGYALMKLAVISDVHFGDPSSTLAKLDGEGRPKLGRAFEPFIQAAGNRNDFLVLLGDIFDFSVSDYATAYHVASNFFAEVNRQELAREILYVPGNHDFSFWNIALHEINVINQIKSGQAPKMRWTIPAVLDARAGVPAQSALTLVGVGAKRAPTAPGDHKYGGLFLDRFTAPPGSALQPMPVNVAYPNAYVCDSEGCTLLTHGHYFEPYWSMTLPIVQRIVGPDLVLQSGEVDLEALVAVNFPLNELASAGLGQAGPLASVVGHIVTDLRTGSLEREKRYLQAAFEYLDDEVFTSAGWCFPKEIVSDAFLGMAKAVLLETLKRQKSHCGARFNSSFLDDPRICTNLDRFLRACATERANIRYQSLEVPEINALIFGHTHRSIPSASPLYHASSETNGPLTIFNTGGWLETTPGGPIDAAVFTYDSERWPRWESRAISLE